jgi:hypothetical protein
MKAKKKVIKKKILVKKKSPKQNIRAMEVAAERKEAPEAGKLTAFIMKMKNKKPKK